LRAFRKKVEQKDAPFLSPLGTSHKTRRERMKDAVQRLPAAAAPIAFTLVGCLIIIVVLGSILAGGQDRTPRSSQAEPAAPTAVTNTQATATPDIADAVPLPEISAPQPDPSRTASIPAAVPPPSALRPDVSIAESEDDITALEEEQRRQASQVDEAAEEAVATPQSDPDQPDPEMREATITGFVNMRAGASDDAEILEVVPARAKIRAEENCDWCPVLYQGRTGYIYRSFISYE
jgi:cytoskeletal protein RodZ